MSAWGPLLVNIPGTGGWTQGRADAPHANTHRTGAGVSVYKESVHAASLQTPCRTAYGGRPLPNALLIKFLYLSTNMCLICVKGYNKNFPT